MEIDWKYAVMAVMAFIILTTQIDSCQSKMEYNENIKAITSQNRTYIKEGQEHTETLIVQMKKNQFKELEGLRGTIKELQDLVKKTPRLISATILKNETINKTTTKIDSIISKDTVIKNDTVYIYPEYKYNVEEEWLNGSVVSNMNNVTLDLKTRNEYDIIVQKQKFKLKDMFKKKNPIMTVVNKNPNTYTTGLKTYTIDCGHHPWRDRLVSGGIGFGLGLLVK